MCAIFSMFSPVCVCVCVWLLYWFGICFVCIEMRGPRQEGLNDSLWGGEVLFNELSHLVWPQIYGHELSRFTLWGSEANLALALCELLNGTALSNMCKATIQPGTQAYLTLLFCLTKTKKEPCGGIAIIHIVVCKKWYIQYEHVIIVLFFLLIKVVVDYQS